MEIGDDHRQAFGEVVFVAEDIGRALLHDFGCRMPSAIVEIDGIRE